MLKAIIFDFDGVLVESVDIKTRSFAGLFADQPPAVVKKIVSYHLRNSGVSRFDKFRYIYKEILKRKITDRIFNSLCRRFSKSVYIAVIKAPFVPGAREFLGDWFLRYKYFLVSATPQKEIQKIAENKRIKHYFKDIFGSPLDKTDIVKKIIAENNFNPKEIVYVGDALSDLEAATKNSIKFIARLYTGNEKLFMKKKCIKINDLKNLGNILRKV